MDTDRRTAVRTSLLLVLFLLISFAAALLFGTEQLNISALLHGTPDDFTHTILFKLRLPRALLVAITGVMLGGAGAAFQLFFRNPLAEPGIMGISGGASLGAVIAACFGTSTLFSGIISPVNFGAFCGALCAGFLVTALSGKQNGPSSTVTLLLCGTALGTLYSALISIILIARSKELHMLYMWMLGSFSGRGLTELRFILFPAAAAALLLLLTARPLDLLSGGETTAASLGVEVKRLRLLVILSGSLAVSAAVCAGGTIGFVGLIAPHIIRKLTGAKSTTLIPFSMAAGAVILLTADTIGRTVASPSELPVGVITALLGAPFFISILFSQRSTLNG
jgi:iron complex transport system permease protein